MQATLIFCSHLAAQLVKYQLFIAQLAKTTLFRLGTHMTRHSVCLFPITLTLGWTIVTKIFIMYTLGMPKVGLGVFRVGGQIIFLLLRPALLDVGLVQLPRRTVPTPRGLGPSLLFLSQRPSPFLTPKSHVQPRKPSNPVGASTSCHAQPHHVAFTDVSSVTSHTLLPLVLTPVDSVFYLSNLLDSSFCVHSSVFSPVIQLLFLNLNLFLLVIHYN